MWGCQGTYLFHSEILDLDHDVGFLIGKSGQQRRIWLECQAGSYSLNRNKFWNLWAFGSHHVG